MKSKFIVSRHPMNLIIFIFIFWTGICFGQAKIRSGTRSACTGILKIMSSQDPILGSEKLSFYIECRPPVKLLDGNKEIGKPSEKLINRIGLLLKSGWPNIEKYVGKKVKITGEIGEAKIIEDKSFAVISNITHVQLKNQASAPETGFVLGQTFTPNKQFEIISTDKIRNLYMYKWIGVGMSTILGRSVGDVLIRTKGNRIAAIVYDLIPAPTDIGVPVTIVNTIQTNLLAPLAQKDGIYGVNIDNTSIAIRRGLSAMTFNKDRIAYITMIKVSLLDSY